MQDVDDLYVREKRFCCTRAEIQTLNPNTCTITAFRSKKDKQLALSVYSKMPVLSVEDEKSESAKSLWQVMLRQGLFNKTSDSSLFISCNELLDSGADERAGNLSLGNKQYLRLYEGKMIHQYTHRWSTYDRGERAYIKPKKESSFRHEWEPLSEFYVSEDIVQERLDRIGWKHKWLLGYRFSTAPTNERTVIASLFPLSAVSNMLPIFFPPEEQALTLLAFLNSLCFDYFARQKMSRQGLDLYKIKQIPVPLPGRNLSSEVQHEIETRVARLIGWQSFAATIISGKLASDTEIPILEEPSRSILRAEIDALCAHAYGLDRKDLGRVPLRGVKPEARMP